MIVVTNNEGRPGVATTARLLQEGAPADVAIMRLVEEPVRFVDTRGNTRPASRAAAPPKSLCPRH